MITIRDIDRDDISGFLGNKLFMIFAAYNLSIINNDVLVLPDFEFNNLFDYRFFSTCNKSDLKIESEYAEPFFHYQKISYSNNMNLVGYFQSEKYFQNITHLFDLLFKPNAKLKSDILNSTVIVDKYEDTKITYDELFKNHKTCSIHVRRGDFVSLASHHPLLPESYYRETIEKIYNDVDYFLICSNDIAWCKTVFVGPKFIFSETEQEKNQGNKSAAFDMFLMSFCDNHIIANSSFSWWSAYLNLSPFKIVYCPGDKYKWFGPSLAHHNVSDLYPESWVKL